MKISTTALAAATLAISLACAAPATQAASAHNSQAGANGPTTNNDAPTGRHLKSMAAAKLKKAM
jgi:Spy/CpxP family protein refolding chaperone